MTTKHTHTPGPYAFEAHGAFDEHGDETIIYQAEDEAASPLLVVMWRDDVGLDTHKADVRLHVAAPDMLAALERAAPWLARMIADGGHLACVAPRDAIGAMRDVERAIARAKGHPAPEDAAYADAIAKAEGRA